VDNGSILALHVDRREPSGSRFTGGFLRGFGGVFNIRRRTSSRFLSSSGSGAFGVFVMPFTPSTGIDDELHLIIGKTIRWWSMIEFTIDSSIRDFLSRSDTENIDTSLKISLPNRVKLFKRLFNQAVNDPESRETFISVMDQITGRQHIRELLVHGFLVVGV